MYVIVLRVPDWNIECRMIVWSWKLKNMLEVAKDKFDQLCQTSFSFKAGIEFV